VLIRIGQTGGIRYVADSDLLAAHLAEHAGEGSFSANDLAEFYGLPHEALAKILQRLATTGVLMSHTTGLRADTMLTLTVHNLGDW
jgi:hypothetical protein